MFKKYLITLGMIAMTALSGQVFATSLGLFNGIDHNGGFEMGFDGYIATDGSDIVTHTTAPSGALYNPTEGDYFAKLHTDSNDMCSGGQCSLVSSFLEMEKGNTFKFDWAYLADEDMDDFSLVLMNGDDTVLEQASNLGHHGDTGWQTFSWTADEDFTGMVTWLAISPADHGQYGNDHSALLVDNAQVLPEPGTIALLGLGLLGMAMSRRRKSL